MSQENVEVVRAFVRAWQREDEATVMQALASDVELRLFPAAVGERVFHGHEGARRAMAAFLSVWEQVEFEFASSSTRGAT